MKIKSKLYISSGLVIFLILILGLVLDLNSNKIFKAEAKHDLLQSFQKTVLSMDLITHEYLTHQEKGMEGQWHARFNSISIAVGHLDEAGMIDPADSIRSNLATLRRLFLQLTELYKRSPTIIYKDSHPKQIEAAVLFKDRLESNLLITYQAIHSTSMALAQQSYSEIIEAHKQSVSITRILMIMIIIIGATTSLFIVRGISQHLKLLAEGTVKIGQGDLDHEIKISGKDELSNLALEFNKMVKNLKQVTASRNDLNIEIESRKVAEKELQVLIKEKSMILDASGDGIYGLDLNGHTVFANPAAEKILGYSLEEMLGHSQHALIHHTRRDGTPYPRAECPTCLVATDGGVHHAVDEVFWRKDGSSFPVEYISTPIVDDGEIKGAVVSFKDITDRIKAEETTSRLGRILDSSSNEIYIFDASTFRFSQVNSGARENLGYSMEELAHLTPLNIKPEHTMETFEKLIKPLRLREKSVVLFETAHKRKNGTLYPVEVKVQLMHEETPPVFIAIIQDITVRKKAEEELQKYREHLEELVEERTVELTRANKQLRELDQLKVMFMASMSHELRTPLNSIIGFTGVLLEGLAGEVNPKQKDYLGRAYQSSKNLLGLISDIMDISKIESGTIEAVPELFNLDKVVTEALDNSCIQKMKSTGLELKIEVPLSLELYSDRKRVLQCLINLLSNAAKFTESGSIRVTAREVGDDIEVMVEDTGIGIAEADLPKLFQQFERLDSPLKIKAGGTGLGLYLTQKLATEVLGGSMSVESQPGVGSKFFLRFPKKLLPH